MNKMASSGWEDCNTVEGGDAMARCTMDCKTGGGGRGKKICSGSRRNSKDKGYAQALVDRATEREQQTEN